MKYLLYSLFEKTWGVLRDINGHHYLFSAKNENDAFNQLNSSGKKNYLKGRFRFVPVRKTGKGGYKPYFSISKIKGVEDLDNAIYKFEKERLGKVL